jgi:hypothetical protein
MSTQEVNAGPTIAGYAPSVAPPSTAAPLETIPPFQPFSFTFQLTDVNIKETRCNKWWGCDTDYLVLSAQVGAQPPLGNATPVTLKIKLGDVHAGDNITSFMPPAAIDSIHVSRADDPIVLQYHVVNAGHGPESQVWNALEGLATTIAAAGGKAIAESNDPTGIGDAIAKALGIKGTILGDLILPGDGSLVPAITGYLTGEVLGFLFPDCDGAVADQVMVTTGGELWSLLRGSKVDGTGVMLTGTTSHPGTDSPSGCGDNSDYTVGWEVDLAYENMLGMTVYSDAAVLWSSTNLGQGSPALQWLIGDVNGDGKAEVLQLSMRMMGQLATTVYGYDGVDGYKVLTRAAGGWMEALQWLVG